MTNTTVSNIKLYTNDIAVERAKQANAGTGTERLGTLRNRIARSKQGNLMAIALVAKENGDATIVRDARQRLEALGTINKGDKLTDAVTIVDSRRPSRSKVAQTLGIAVAAETVAAVDALDADLDAAIENDVKGEIVSA